MDEDRTGRSAPPPNHPDLDIRVVKHGLDFGSLTPLEVRMAVAKGSSKMRAAGPKVDMSNSIGDACVSDMLKMNFLSSQSACVKLVDHIH